jgi:hypothetical protein
LRFFLTGVEETANQAGQTAQALMRLAAADEKRIQVIGKAAGSAMRVHLLLRRQPILSIASAGKELKLSVPTVTASMKHLTRLGITRETTGRNYRCIYAYDRFLKILNEGTEPNGWQSPSPIIRHPCDTLFAEGFLAWMFERYIRARKEG